MQLCTHPSYIYSKRLSFFFAPLGLIQGVTFLVQNLGVTFELHHVVLKVRMRKPNFCFPIENSAAFYSRIIAYIIILPAWYIW